MSALKTSGWFIVAFATCLMGCDPGSKSVSGTADEAGDGGSDGDSTGGMSEPANPTVGNEPDSGDGNTSQGPGDGGDGTGDIPTCLETSTEITDLNQVTPLGFTAEDIISISNGWTTDFVWTTDNGDIDVVPEGTTTTLDIGMTYSGGAINYIDSEFNPDYTMDGLFECDDRFEIEFDITFNTADGRFAESFAALGQATTADGVSIEEYFDPHGFSGTFSADEVSFPDDKGMVNQFAIFADFHPDTPPEGSVDIEVREWLGDDPNDAFIGFGPIAGFPSIGE